MCKTNQTTTSVPTQDTITFNPNDCKGDLVDEMKEMLREYNQNRYKVLSESTETVIVRSRLFPVIPTRQSLTHEQTRCFNNILECPEITLAFDTKRVIWESRRGKDTVCLKDAVIKVRFVGDKNYYDFYSWDYDYLYATITIGYDGDDKDRPRVFLANFIGDETIVWELEELYILADTGGYRYRRCKEPEALGDDSGLFIGFNRSCGTLLVNSLNLGFEVLYYDIDGGGIALLSKEEMELCQARVTVIQSDATVDDTADIKGNN